MYLKRLELIGFKSFANRTELEFVPGVTAVVGPNGSGKSNIADAIRWVLGEQSAKSLRGSKMEDIIFAGSDTRKPVNYCEVALTLDNADRTLKLDYSEVTITRRVYRSGDSEYYINKQSCRLRDIVELFMDTGVGKEAYSIIGQGRIEEILSTKSEDRRGIFEEAAGIVKYKNRKKEAEKKLEETQANLVRLSDIISEISEQIGPLKEQAERAKTFLDLKEQLKQQEIGLYLYLIEDLNRSWETSKSRLKALKEQHAVHSSEVNRLDAEHARWRWQMNEQDEQLEAMQVQLLEVSEEAEKTEGRRDVLRERKKNVSENQKSTEEKKAQLESSMGELTRQLETERKRLSDLNEEFAAIQNELKDHENLLHEVSKELDSDVEQLKGEYIDLLNRMASSKNDLRHCEKTIESLRHKQKRLMEDFQQMAREEEQIYQNKLQVEEELEQIGNALNECLDSYRHLSVEVKSRQQQKEEISQALRKLEQTIHSLLSRKDLLQEMQTEFTGFMQGVKEILKARKKGLKGVHGAVAELISVPAELETAVEVALGGAMQHVVVSDETAARAAIQWLKENRSGRATFLPVDVIKPRKLPGQDQTVLKQLEGFVGIASDLVKSGSEYRNIVENLLGSVVIMQTLEQANVGARKTGYRYRFVTVDGDVVNPGGSMTGGSVQQKNTNLLGRNRRLEELEREIKNRIKERDQLANQLEEADDQLQNLFMKQDELRELGESWRKKEQEIKAKLTELEIEHKNSTSRLSLHKKELAALQDEEREHEEKQRALAEQIEQWGLEEEDLKKKIADFETHRAQLQISKEKYNEQITDLKVKSAEIRKQKEAVLSLIQRMEQELAALREEYAKANETLNSLRDMQSGNTDNEEELDKRLSELRQQREALSRQIVLHKQQRTEMVQRMEHLDAELKMKRRRMKEVEDDLHREEVKANRFEVELDNLLLKLQEEYDLSYDVAKEMFDRPDDPAATKQIVAGLKQNIQALGNVNLGAIEEYERQSERLEFLTGQSHDLGEAKRTLHQVIQEFDKEMSKRFMETFELIREQFQQVFKHLFAGGRADLQLSDPNSILTTGIDIVAQPPGKKLQHLALLSGGEKALTAIALLFAILRVKPVPFCVLDEVEAALDDANVYRFADYLREFSGQTQFICVTHRKGTMEGADVLYGVTMEESGISKLVSVKLEDAGWVSESA